MMLRICYSSAAYYGSFCCIPYSYIIVDIMFSHLGKTNLDMKIITSKSLCSHILMYCMYWMYCKYWMYWSQVCLYLLQYVNIHVSNTYSVRPIHTELPVSLILLFQSSTLTLTTLTLS